MFKGKLRTSWHPLNNSSTTIQQTCTIAQPSRLWDFLVPLCNRLALVHSIPRRHAWVWWSSVFLPIWAYIRYKHTHVYIYQTRPDDILVMGVYCTDNCNRMVPAVSWRRQNAPSLDSKTPAVASEAAVKEPDFAGFGYMQIRWVPGLYIFTDSLLTHMTGHPPKTDKQHCTVRVKTIPTHGTHKVAHIYTDASTNLYSHHVFLYSDQAWVMPI